MLLTATTFVYGCSDYDDSQLSGRLDDIKERIAKLQDRIASLNSQLADLSELTSGNVITEMTEDSEGNYIITYKDNKNEEKSIVLATVDQMLNVPLLGVELDPQNNLYYWTVTADGKTSPLLDKAGEKVPVSGYTPEVSVDAEGFWTVNGERLNDAEGDPIEANDGESCLFKDIARDANGNLSLTLGDGKIITLPIQQVLNLTLSTAINTTVVDPTVPATIEYELHGEHAAEALVGIAEAEGVEIVLDRKQQRITVTFPTGFDDGYMIAMAYDMQEHTVLRPVFFTKATSDRIEIRTAEELVQFAENVNAGTGAQRMTAVLMNDIDMTKIASWIPIGNGSFVATASESKVEGAAFEGTFDGQGHALLNCKMTGALTSDNQVYGLFGILKGATVRNLVLGAESGDTGSFTVSGNGTTSTGVIAGACVDSKIEKCTSYLPMVCEGNNSANKLMTMGLVGFVYGAGTSEDTVSQLTDLTNYGALKADPGAANANGFTSTQVGGIAGFSNTSRTSTFVPALHKSRRHDRFDRTRFGHRRRSQHLHAHRRMRELRRHDEYLCGLQGRTSGQHHLHPRHPVDHKRLHQPRRRRDDQLPIPRRRTALSVQCHRLRNHQFGQLRQRNLRPYDLPRHARSQYQQPRKDGQQHRRRRNRILQRRRLRNGRHQRNELHGLYRKDQGRQRRARDQYQVRRRGLDGQRHSHGRRSRGSRGCGQLRQAARRMAKRKRRDLPADRHRHVRGRRMDTHRQGDLRHRKQQTHGLRNPLRRTFQRPGLPDPQSENGRCEQRGGGYIRIVRNFGTRRRDREFLVRHRLFVHRRVHSRFIERRSGRTGLRRYGA